MSAILTYIYIIYLAAVHAVFIFLIIIKCRPVRLSVSKYDGGLLRMCDVSRLLLSQQGKMWGTICHVSHRFCCDVPSGVEEATVACRPRGVTAWQWCQEFMPALQGKSLTCKKIPNTVRRVFTGPVWHRHWVRQSDTHDYQNQLIDCSALVVSEIIWLENQPYRYDKARLIL